MKNSPRRGGHNAMGRVAATFASTLCLLIGMTAVAMAKDGRGDDDRSGDRIGRIANHIVGQIQRSDYDGLSDDLLTAGLARQDCKGRRRQSRIRHCPRRRNCGGLRSTTITGRWWTYRPAADTVRSMGRWWAPRDKRRSATARSPGRNIWRCWMAKTAGTP